MLTIAAAERCATPNQKSPIVSIETGDPMPALGQERTSTVHLPMSAFPPEADIERSDGLVRLVPILLQKSLMAPAWSDSLVQTRFGVEAGDDGAAQSRPKAAVLFI